MGSSAVPPHPVTSASWPWRSGTARRQPGESVVFVYLKDSTRASDVPDLWYQVRKKVGDIKQTLPQGVQGPFFNDEFGDTYALIFALTSDGFSHRELRDYAERVRG